MAKGTKIFRTTSVAGATICDGNHEMRVLALGRLLDQLGSSSKSFQQEKGRCFFMSIMPPPPRRYIAPCIVKIASKRAAISAGSGYYVRNSIRDHEILYFPAGVGGNVRPGARGVTDSTARIRLLGAIRDSSCAIGRKIGAADADPACGAEIDPSASVAACGRCAEGQGRG
jgi:hypothetical protein